MPVKLPTITESEFLDQVLQYAALRRWRTAHFRPARTVDGWRTAVAGDGKGFPDLLLCRERIVVAELKVGRNQLTGEQRQWLMWFEAAGIPAYTWRPDDWAEIEQVLQ